MNNNNILLGLALGFILGNDKARNAAVNMANKMFNDINKDLNKPSEVNGSNGTSGDFSSLEQTRNQIEYKKGVEPNGYEESN